MTICDHGQLAAKVDERGAGTESFLLRRVKAGPGL